LLLILSFTSYHIFQRKSKEWDFWWVSCFFLNGLFQKLVAFLVGSNNINTEDNYGRLIEFLSQISKLSYLIL